MWIIYDLAVLFYQLILFTAAGYGFSCFAFYRSRHWPMRLVWAPFFGMIVLTVISADLMYNWLPGQYASWLALILCGFTSLALAIIFAKKSGSKRKLYWQPMLPAAVAAILFISPLLLSNSRGYFALNGGDFGSYGGWGEYFADKTCLNGREEKPINFTAASFVFLQNLLKKPSTGWRMGNITYFVFIKDTSPADFYTSYECCIALNYYILILLVFAFCRDVLNLRLRYALSVSWAYILCNTITWLGMSHFLGNLIGLVILVGIQALLVNCCRRPQLPQGAMLCTAVGAALLQYPELLPYCAAIIGPVLLISLGCKRDQLITTVKVGLIALAGGFLLVAPYLRLAVNWVLPMFSQNARVDNVGIYKWAYASQLLGLVDYDFVLRNEGFANVFQITMLCTVVASVLALFSLRRDRSLRPALGLLAGIGIVVLGCARFAITHNLFFLFRSYVSLSTFVFLFPAISAVRAFWAIAKRSQKPPSVLVYALAALSVIFFISLATVRFSMIKRVQKGTPHARVFGTRYLKLVEILTRLIAEKHADYLIVDYHGSGTIQANWEFLLQKLPYVFPTAGQGCTPFRTDFLADSHILILDEGYPRVLQIEGREVKAAAGGQFANYSIYDTAETDAILAFSNSWSYGSAIADLTLMGVPGNIVLWSHDRGQQPATVKLSLVPPQRRCRLRILFNNSQVADFQLAPHEPPGNLAQLQFDVDVHKGLNTLTLIPEFDQDELKDRQQFVKTVRAEGMAASSDARRIADLVENGSPPMDPRLPATDPHWNLVRPPINQPGFAPYLIFQSIKVIYH